MRLAFLAILTIAISCSRQNDAPNTKKLREATVRFGEALNSRDFDTVARMTHPRVVDGVGGHQKLVALLRQSFEKLPSTKVQFDASNMPLSLDSGLAVIVPYEASMIAPEGDLQMSSFYIAWSPDAGESWFFADGNKAHLEGYLNFLFPGYRNELSLPKPTPLKKKQSK